MGDLTKNMSRHEFACRCSCGFEVCDIWIVEACQKLRDRFGPTNINSGCRCESHNSAVGGLPTSFHTKGLAVDVSCSEGNPVSWMEYLRKEYPRRFQYKTYDTFLHIEYDNINKK